MIMAFIFCHVFPKNIIVYTEVRYWNMLVLNRFKMFQGTKSIHHKVHTVGKWPALGVGCITAAGDTGRALVGLLGI